MTPTLDDLTDGQRWSTSPDNLNNAKDVLVVSMSPTASPDYTDVGYPSDKFQFNLLFNGRFAEQNKIFIMNCKQLINLVERKRSLWNHGNFTRDISRRICDEIANLLKSTKQCEIFDTFPCPQKSRLCDIFAISVINT